MSEPIVFISHFRIKEGRFDALKQRALDTADGLQSEKPRTILFLSYVDEDRSTISFVHAFADAEAMALDVEKGEGTRRWTEAQPPHRPAR